ncbi:putative reverse transcriptase domain-containing protein, partial [Tanacetum coccineum]
YYRRFIEGFSKIAKSMMKLTQKGIKFDWGEKEEKAFQLIKQKLCSAPILALPEGSEDFVVYCDASRKGLGAVLMQREKEKVIAYALVPTGNRSKLMNFVEKFIGSVRFGNDHLGVIMGYGDYVMGDSVISRVYYMEGLGHNLFSIGQFCDSDLEVAFRKHTCFVHDIKGTNILHT